jgi:hypothetical protein
LRRPHSGPYIKQESVWFGRQHILILFGGAGGARWGNVAESYFIRKKKGYFHFPAIKHANKHIAEVSSEAGILVIAGTRELPIHRVRHAIASG